MKAVVCCVLLVVGVLSSAVAQNGVTETIDNKDKSFTLIKSDSLNDSGIPVLKYKVMRNADKKVILEGSVAMGKLEWSADYELTESKSTGTAASLNLSSRKIDLRPYLIKN